MTEPATGEGIGNAIDGGLAVAEVAHTALRGARGDDWHEGVDLGSELAHRFLRLGQDVDVIRRISARRAASPHKRSTTRRHPAREQPFLTALVQGATEPYQLPTVRDTPVYRAIGRNDGEIAAALDALNDRCLGVVSTPLPFAPEALHVRLLRNLGPVTGALVVLTARFGGRAADSVVV